LPKLIRPQVNTLLNAAHFCHLGKPQTGCTA
jgi:hypothetical protein